MRTAIRALLVVGLLAAGATAWAKGPAYTDPKKTDADFAYQGEYVGTVADSGEKIGVQIIALGEGKFRAVGHHGGLPGDGWDGKDKREVDGTSDDDGSVTFKDDVATAVLKDGKLTVTVDGNQVAEMKKVNRKSKTLGQKPPEGAVVLFDGKSADQFKGGKMTKDGHLQQGCTSIPRFNDFTLHIEFRLPYQPQDRGQGRGNSGIYMQGRYEVQMLDSFGLKGKHNECGGIYSVKDPDVNMCYPPLSWQTYDVEYTAAKFKDGKLVSSPRMTVRHNGVVIHDNVELPGNRNTTAAPLKPGPEPGPIYLQNHGNPVRYRNIWVVEKKS